MMVPPLGHGNILQGIVYVGCKFGIVFIPFKKISAKLSNRDHRGMRVTGRIDRDACGKIKEEITVDVLDGQAFATNRDDRVGTGQAGRRPCLVERDVRASLGPGEFRDDMRDGTIPSDLRRAR